MRLDNLESVPRGINAYTPRLPAAPAFVADERPLRPPKKSGAEIIIIFLVATFVKGFLRSFSSAHSYKILSEVSNKRISCFRVYRKWIAPRTLKAFQVTSVLHLIASHRWRFRESDSA